MSAYGKVKKDKGKHSNRPTPLGSKPSSSSSSSSSAYPPSRPRSSHHLVYNHALGQHILSNPGVVTDIIKLASIRPTDTVLEVGPGTGNLTMKLLADAKKVVVVEYDVRMIAELQKRVTGTEHAHKLQIVHGDVLKVQLPYFDLCVSNLPYQISSPFTFKLLSHRPPFRHAILMYQREFAQRLIAQPSQPLFCRLSLNTQLLAHVHHLKKVDRKSFNPPPKVDSSVVRVEPRIPVPPVNFLEWDGLVRLCFNRKNKELGSVFKGKHVKELLRKNWSTAKAMGLVGGGPGGLGVGVVGVGVGGVGVGGGEVGEGGVEKVVAEVWEETGLSKTRANKMGQEDFLRLLAAFNKRGLHFTAMGADTRAMGLDGEEEEDDLADLGMAEDD